MSHSLPKSVKLLAATRDFTRFLAFLSLAVVARAQFTYSESFKNSTAPGWVLNPAGNSTPGAVLTSGLAPRSGDPETGATIDPAGAGWLRLTNNTLNLANAVYFDTPIPSAGNSVTIAFGANMFGGNKYNNTGADGFTFFLYDASKNFNVGAYGGSIGYAQRTDTSTNGLNGAYVGIAFDAYGNFSVSSAGNSEGRYGGTTSLQPNTVVVRGPGSGLTGYNYLAGTGNFNYTATGSPTVQDATDPAVPAVPYTMAFPNATSRPNQSTQYRNISITIDQNSQLSVNMQFGEDGLWYQLLNVDLSSFVRPEDLKLGFAAGTGSGTLVTEVGGLLTIQATAGTGNFIWDNGKGPSDSGTGTSIWGTGANDPLNWAGQTNPTLKSNVIFNSTYINSAQTISVNGSDKVITNMYFSGPNAYTLTTSEARKLIFDAATAGGLTTISLTNDVNGNSAHTIGLDVQMNQNLDINNNISPTFTITGNIDTGGNILGLKGTGTTVLSGAISGAGSLEKRDSGTTILTGGNVNTYTGNTTVFGGTLQIENANALGSTSAGTIVNASGTLALGGTGTTFAAESLTLNGDGVSNAGALRNVAGANTWTGTVALGTTGSNSIGVDAGSLTISGVISGAAGNNLTKVGNGALTLSGTNTYNGSTTINAGTLAVSADANLGTAPGAATAGQLTLNGGTLETTSTMTLNANRGVALGTSGGTFQTDAGTTLTYNGIAAGTGSLTKTGTGTMNLGGANTYSGATMINAGTVQLGANNALANTTAVVVASGATFDVNAKSDTIGSLAGAGSVTLGSGGALTVGADNTSTTFSGTVTGTGANSITKSGTGTMVVSGAAGAFAPATLNLSGGTVQLGSNNILSGAVVFGGGTLSINGKTDSIASATLAGVSTVDYNSLAGSLNLLASANTFTSGTLTISNWAGSTAGAGASQLLVANNTTALSATFLNAITFAGYGAGAKIILNANGQYEVVPNTGNANTWNVDGSSNWNTAGNWLLNGGPGTGVPNGIGATANFDSKITAPVTVTQNLAGAKVGYMNFNNPNAYTLSGTNTITMQASAGSAQINVSNTGAVNINTGLVLNSALVINQNSTGTLTIGGTNSITGTNQNLTVNGAGNTSVTGIIATGSGTLTKNNSGTLTLSGVNTFTGATTINGGTVAIAADLGLGAAPGVATAAQLTLNGGTLQVTATATLATNRGTTLGAGGGTVKTDAATTTTYGGIIAGSSGGSLTKDGAGTLIVSGANTYNGATVIAGGTLQLNSATSVPSASGVSMTGASTTLNLNNTSPTIGSLTSAQTTATVTLGSGTLTTGGDNTSTLYAGTITGTGGLTKTGNGTFTLTGNNTYTGATNINVGSLNIQNNGALGTTAGTTTIASGAALEVQGGITTAEAISLSGTGVNTNGAIRNISGANTLSGALTLSGNSTLKSETGTLTLSGAIASSGASRALTLAGAGNITVSNTLNLLGSGTTGALIKNDSGYAILAGAGTYSGGTSVNAGTLEIQNGGALGTAAGGTTVASGATLAVSGNISSNQNLTINGQGANSNGAVRNLSGNNTLSGTVALGSAAYIGVDSAATLTTTGVISGTNSLTKTGNGTLVMNGSANNTYVGTTNVAAGTLEIRQAGQLGTGVATVSDGATLRVNGNGLSIAQNVTLTGSGVGGLGALQGSGGSDTWAGNLTMIGNTSIGVASGSTLTASGTIANTANTSYNLTKTDAGTLAVSGANTYAGTTTVSNGTLSVNSNAPVSNNGALGSSGTTVQIGDANTAAAYNLGLVIGNATGGVSVDRPISVNNFNTSGTSTLGSTNTSGTNTFSGNIGLGRTTQLTSATGGTVAFSGAISGTGGVTATGTGTVVLSGSNSFSGATTINSGATLVAANGSALGATGGTTTVASGGTLGVQGNITLPAGEAITLTGSAAPTVAAFSNLSGANTVASPITLAGAASNTVILNSTAGTATFTGGFTESGGAKNISTSGAGATVLASTASITGGVTLAGSAGASLTLASGASLPNASGITVNTGNTLAFGANNQVGSSTNLALNGGTVSVGGFTQTMRQVSSTAAGGTLDYLNDGSKLTFNSNNSLAGLGTLSSAISVANWAGSLTGGGSESLVVYSSTNIAGAVSNINFPGWGSGANNATAISLGSNLYEIVPSVTATDWKTGNATWLTGTNWSPNTAPNSSGAIARFGNFAGVTGNPTVDIAAAGATAGVVLFDSGSATHNYTITGPGTLTLNNGGSSAQINVNDNNSHVITAPINSVSSTVVTNTSSAATGLTLGNMAQSATATSLTFTGTGNTTVTGAITQTAGSTALVKTGSGNLVLNGANTYTGTTTLRSGVLEIGNASALGNTASAVIVNDASTTGTMNTSLFIGANAVTLSRNVTVGSQGNVTTLGGDATLANGTATYSGTIALSKSVSLEADNASTVNFNGAITNTAGTNSLTKIGTGTVVLGSGSNSYTGATVISAGTLKLGAANAIPNGSAVTVASGATLNTNALSDTIGSLGGAGNVTLGSPGSATTLTTGGDNTSTTLSGIISGGANAGLVKTGTGTMTLTGANTYSGSTTVNAGTLVAANNTALGSSAGPTSVAGNATLALQGGITVSGQSLNVTATTSPNVPSISNVSGTNAWTGNIVMTGATANDQVKYDAAGGSQLTLSGNIGEATNAKVFAKTGTGTIVLSGNNTFTGSTNVIGGTLIAASNNALGTATVTNAVQIGATLGVQGNVTIPAGQSFTLNGTTNPPPAPSISNISDTNVIQGNLTLSGGLNTGVAINSNVGSLTLNGAIAQSSQPNFVVKTGSGDLVLGGTNANTFSGGFTINDGRVIAAKSANVTATGAANVNIGDGIGAAASAVLQLNASNQISGTSNLTIATDGKLDLQGNNNTVGAVTMSGGSVTASVTTPGNGTLGLGGNLTFTGVGANTAVITANVDLGNTTTRIVQVGNNGSNSDIDLSINGTISGGTGGTTGFNKTDLGVLELTGTTSNTFTGNFQVSDGTVLLNKTAGLNATGASNTVTVGDNVNSAGTAILKLGQSNQIVDSATVTVKSDGKFDLNGLTETIGAIAGTGNIETRAGTLTIQGTNSVSVFNGTLTDSTGTIGVENNIPGYTNGFVTSVGSGRIVLDLDTDHNGSGSMTFASNIAYAGTLELKSGTLVLPGVNFTVGELDITGNTILDFGNSAASIINATNIKMAPGASLTITNWVNNVDFFFAQNWLPGTTTPGINTRGVGDELQITFTGFSNTSTAWLDYNNASKHQITPAPEPSTYGALFVGGALAFLGYRRWRKSATR